MKRLRLFLLRYTGPAAWGTAATLLVVFVLLYRLGVTTPGANSAEVTAAASSTTLAGIIENPVNLPHKLVQFGLQKIGGHGLFWVRSASALYGLVAVMMFFYIVRRWHTTRVAVFGTLLFATSSWFLHSARFGDAEVLQMLLQSLLVAGIWLRESRRRSLALIGVALAATLLIYIPGMIWFVLAAGIWQRKVLLREMRHIPAAVIVAAVVGGIAFLAPLGYGLFSDSNLYRPLLGLPESFLSPIDMGKRLLDIPINLLVRGPDNPALWLGRLPVLDIFTSAMLFLGVYTTVVRRRLDRVKFLAGAGIIGVLLITIGGPVTLSILLPLLYIVASAGITFMIQTWFTVFPRNPVARSIATTLISIAVLMSSFYNLSRYFIAWSSAPETKAVYTQELQE